MSILALSDIDAIKQRHVCHECVGEEFLSAEIKKDGASATCDYCKSVRSAISIDELSHWIESAFESHYQRTPDQPSSFDYAMMKESSYEWEREGEPVTDAIASAAEIDEEIAADVQAVLEYRHYDRSAIKAGEECDFDENSFYAEIGPNDIEFKLNWRAFEESIKTSARYFNKVAEGTLASIFEGIKDHETRDGKRVVIEAGPKSEMSAIYRARVFQATDPLKEALVRPDRDLGPPPANLARAGRMNAHGIPIFYGALDPDTAVAEIRPPVGSRVMIGKFNFLRPVRLLDVAALQSVWVKGSIFDGGYMYKLERAKFLGSLSRRITMPVMPDDEVSEYLVTQAIAEYLASEVGLDGILFPSAQAGGAVQNIALFHQAARVKAIDLPKGTKITAVTEHSSEEGTEPDYWVFEEVPPPTTPQPRERRRYPWLIDEAVRQEDANGREATLELDTTSLKVLHIASVKFGIDAYDVHRARTNPGPQEF